MSVHPAFYDHEVVQRLPHEYIEMVAPPMDLLDAWSLSMFAHELLYNDGSIKAEADMNDVTLDRYLNALSNLKKGEPMPRPVLGIGIMDGVEIGLGREIIAACATLNISEISFHVRQAQAKEIKKLLKI